MGLHSSGICREAILPYEVGATVEFGGGLFGGTTYHRGDILYLEPFFTSEGERAYRILRVNNVNVNRTIDESRYEHLCLTRVWTISEAQRQQVIESIRTRPHAVQWLKWTGIVLGGIFLLLILTGIFGRLIDKMGTFGTVLLLLVVGLPALLLPVLIPGSLCAYMYYNPDDSYWFILDAHGYGWLGFIAWLIVCIVGGRMMIDGVFKFFTNWSNPFSTILQLLGSGLWGYYFYLAIPQFCRQDSDLFLLLALVFIAALSGAGRGMGADATLVDQYGGEIHGSLAGNRFFGGGHSYSRGIGDVFTRD